MTTTVGATDDGGLEARTNVYPRIQLSLSFEARSISDHERDFAPQNHRYSNNEINIMFVLASLDK